MVRIKYITDNYRAAKVLLFCGIKPILQIFFSYGGIIFLQRGKNSFPTGEKNEGFYHKLCQDTFRKPVPWHNFITLQISLAPSYEIAKQPQSRSQGEAAPKPCRQLLR